MFIIAAIIVKQNENVENVGSKSKIVQLIRAYWKLICNQINAFKCITDIIPLHEHKSYILLCIHTIRIM